MDENTNQTEMQRRMNDHIDEMYRMYDRWNAECAEFDATANSLISNVLENAPDANGVPESEGPSSQLLVETIDRNPRSGELAAAVVEKLLDRRIKCTVMLQSMPLLRSGFVNESLQREHNELVRDIATIDQVVHALTQRFERTYTLDA